MKRILVLTALILVGQYSVAQDNAASTEKFRFGLILTPSINWYKPEGKIIEGNGASLCFGGGLSFERRLTKVASFQTGFIVNSDGGKVKYINGDLTAPNANTVSYFYSIAGEEIVKYDEALVGNPEYIHYQLNERQYKSTYLTIPLGLKLKTKEIGMLTYFGQIGLNSSFRWKSTANDNVAIINSTLTEVGTTATLSKVVVTKDVNIINETLTFGLGTEMNFSGTTSLIVGLNYNLGFTNAVKGESDYLQKRTNSASAVPAYSPMTQSLKSQAVVLTVGVLF